ncbi:MAG: ABC-ATPase domain-containing protein, partial [Acidobacteriota bacterium]
MKDSRELELRLRRIDGRGYKAYKDIAGSYDFRNFILHIDHVQSDPFAPPSRIRVQVSQRTAQFPPDTYENKSRSIGLSDYLTRNFASQIRKFSRGIRGTGKSGLIEIDTPGQEILERTSARINSEYVEARFGVGLPAAGRRIISREAMEIFFRELPRIVEASLFFQHHNSSSLYRHIKVNEDQDDLRSKLPTLGLVAFVANESLLPRVSGVDNSPMSREEAVIFKSPPSLETTITVRNRGEVKGMGIRKAVTLIVGGGYHGKSTLLRAIELGVYNQLSGDGREYVVTIPEAVKIRAEDGRYIEKVDITPFISNLPLGKSTADFSTDDASGSTSQAANIIEALEVGASLMLIDEDTSATNFMIRDHRMQQLVAKQKEPITPFIDKVRYLAEELGVSTIVVIGGSGDYFDVADCVIKMEDYLPYDVSAEASAIAEKYKAERKREGGESFGLVNIERIPLRESINPSRGRREVKVGAKGMHTISFGRQTIDLGAVEQIVSTSQTRSIADIIVYARSRYMDNRHS